jgi:hypothetical protein
MEGDPGSSKKEDGKIEEAAMWLVLLPLFGFLKVEQPSGNETCNNRLTNCRLQYRRIKNRWYTEIYFMYSVCQSDFYTSMCCRLKPENILLA